MASPLSFSVREIDVRVGEAWTRLPFRYGNACLTAVPLLHLELVVEAGPTGSPAVRGVAADCLPPRWFDKDPLKDFRANVDDQLAAIEIAREVYLAVASDQSPTSVHELWLRAFPEVITQCVEQRGLNRLTASFGSSLVERAAIDAACRAAGVSFHRALIGGVLGYEAGPELPPAPLETIHCRHTVGLGDSIYVDDIPEEERLDDGLPQALEEDIETYGIRYFKVKVNGDHDRDLDRLNRMAELFARRCADGYRISFDGNEQYRDLADLERLLDALNDTENGRRFLDSVLYIEQPLTRELALNSEVREDVTRLSSRKPVIIDESDDDLDAFERAVSLGYRGCSVKNCKGVFKALRNRRICHERNQEAGTEAYFQTGEDLANLPVVPLQQDLATLASLGVGNAERNGHHYFRGLRHLPEAERDAAVRAHPDLYESRGDEAFLRIEGGQIRCASLQAPGFGYSCELAQSQRIPVADWGFERLRLD